MILTREISGNVQREKVISEDLILERLKTIDPFLSPYIILETQDKNYIQAAGAKNRLTIELRIYSGDSFKHFVIGKKEQSKIWCVIDSKVGPIRVLQHEILNFEDAAFLFKTFFRTHDIDTNYNKRNVTKFYLRS